MKNLTLPYTANNASNELAVILLVATALFELTGTVTVAFNYYRSARVAKQIVDSHNPEYMVAFHDHNKLASLADQLTPRAYLTVGLVAYALGAGTGLLAGLVGLFHWHL